MIRQAILRDSDFQANLRGILRRSGRSMRGLSAAFGRDPGYVASLLTPRRPSRARPTPVDLVRAADVLGIPFVDLLEDLWGVPRDRLARELAPWILVSERPTGARLSATDRAALARYVDFLIERSSLPGDGAET
jgi:hypothetical protein